MAPGRIGAMMVRNRIVMSPMETMYGTPDGLPSERTRDYFAARATGGVGLITLGATGVDHQHPETTPPATARGSVSCAKPPKTARAACAI
jgi:2,4-dienoyl-CoA reductase-like NADH-dependent reductase (Old Yellow Enzyme family)